MGFSTPYHHILSYMFLAFIPIGMASSGLSSTFYSAKCPKALSTIRTAVNTAVANENRMGASLLRLHFHDCFVNASFLSLLFHYNFFLCPCGISSSIIIFFPCHFDIYIVTIEKKVSDII